MALRRSYGPRPVTVNELRGIRFLVPEADNGDGAGDDKPSDKGAYTPPKSQDEFDRIIQERLARESKKFEGFDDYRAKAEKFDKLPKPDGSSSPEDIAEAAREEGRAEIRAQLAEERVNNALKSALTGRAVDPSVLVLGFDKKQFIREGGADVDAINRWVNANSAEVKSGKTPDPSQGGRDSSANGGSVSAGRDLFDQFRKPKS